MSDELSLRLKLIKSLEHDVDSMTKQAINLAKRAAQLSDLIPIDLRYIFENFAFPTERNSDGSIHQMTFRNFAFRFADSKEGVAVTLIENQQELFRLETRGDFHQFLRLVTQQPLSATMSKSTYNDLFLAIAQMSDTQRRQRVVVRISKEDSAGGYTYSHPRLCVAKSDKQSSHDTGDLMPNVPFFDA